MADSLILTGVRDVRKHKGSEMLFRYPKGGGNTHHLKRWWAGGSSTVYVDCTVFDVTVGGQTVKLAIDSSSGTNLRIDHDGAFNFNFYGMNEVSRAALFTSGFELIEHYVFPRISGGKIMTVTPPDAASRPNAAPTPDPTPEPDPTPDPDADDSSDSSDDSSDSGGSSSGGSSSGGGGY